MNTDIGHSETIPTGRHLRLPADRFFWALLDIELPAQALRGLGRPAIRAVLDEALVPQVPLPVEELASAYAPAGLGQVLACAMRSSAIAEIEGMDDRVVTLCPASLPEWVQAPVDVGDLNLLIDSHEPQPLRDQRARRSMMMAAGLALIGMITCIGLVRRLNELAHLRLESAAAIRELHASPVGTSLHLDPDNSPLAVMSELSRLRATRQGAGDAMPVDVAATLEPLLRLLPPDAKAQVSDLSVSASSITIGAAVPGNAEADKLTAAFLSPTARQQLSRWSPPRTDITGGDAGPRVRLTFERRREPGNPTVVPVLFHPTKTGGPR